MTNTTPIIFLGGVHGVGKSTLCNELTRRRSDVQCFTASALIKEANASSISTEGKRVANVTKNQELLAEIFAKKIRDSQAKYIILDGHYALRDSKGTIKPLGIEVFRSLKVTALACVTDDASEIAKRLSARDGTNESIESVEELQKSELANAAQIGIALSLNFIKIKIGDIDSLDNALDITNSSSTHI